MIVIFSVLTSCPLVYTSGQVVALSKAGVTLTNSMYIPSVNLGKYKTFSFVTGHII